MKKLIVLFTLAVACTISGIAEDRLDIMVNNQFIGTMNYGFMSGGFVSTWVPYHNGLAVSEPSFYRIIGDWNTAAKAQTWQNWKYGFAWTGVGIILAACAGSILYYAKTNDPDGSIGIIGLGTGAGLIPVTVAICFGQNFRPLPYAVHLAQKYNTANQ
jgi:hypothetical protein